MFWRLGASVAVLMWGALGCSGQIISGVEEERYLRGAGLWFEPDPGIRIRGATVCAPGVDSAGMVYLYHRVGPDPYLAISEDGLNFGEAFRPVDMAHDPRRVLMPEEEAGQTVWRFYRYDFSRNAMISQVSTDGVHFFPESGIRYEPHESDGGAMGVQAVFANDRGEVVMLYVGALGADNNLRRAVSVDNGWTFEFDEGDILGDAIFGGRGESHVDPQVTRLPDGTLRLFTMRQGPQPPHPPFRKVGTVHSHLSDDGGYDFVWESGMRLRCEDFIEFEVYSLHDPYVVLMPDGKYRMYVTALISDGAGDYGPALVSATADPALGVGGSMRRAGRWARSVSPSRR